MNNNPKIVTIGGGTGSFNILKGLKTLTPNITAIISMVDDGGSTGQLRDDLGVLPPGDIRQALVALSRSSDLMRELFNYRFEDGGSFAGHSFGNVFISTMEKVTGNFTEAVEATSKVLNIKGKVVPVTLENTRLVLKFNDGKEVEGEHWVDELPFPEGERPDVYLRPSSKINPDAAEAIKQADVIVIAPGTLHASLIPNFQVEGMKEALAESHAKIIYICNLVTNAGQTDGYRVDDFASEIERFAGKILDYVFYNTEQPSQDLLDKYTNAKDYGVEIDQANLDQASYKAIGGNFIAEPDGADSKGRMFIRHDAKAITALVDRIANGEQL
ncbi:YvcK family protein [Candidatus Saccharibacteria bacterium]|nr:YvcK family protein [Candidatus Saccharibacteria bacterium]MBP9132199.1 YvcK family protein [Candidatus Saccharibacteria bacterium]